MTVLATRSFSSRASLEAALGERLGRAIAASGPSAIMLSGGTTPLPAYRALASGPLPHDALALGPQRLLRVRTELPLEQAAAEYERALGELLGSGVRIGLGLLGLGADGHTASLFGEADLERARGRLAIAVHRPDGMSAVSVTPELIARVSEPVFVVAGPDKRTAIDALVAGDLELTAWRAVQGCARVELWMNEVTQG